MEQERLPLDIHIIPTRESYANDEEFQDSIEVDDLDKSSSVDFQRGLDIDTITVDPGEPFEIKAGMEGRIDGSIRLLNAPFQSTGSEEYTTLMPGKYLYDGSAVKVVKLLFD